MTYESSLVLISSTDEGNKNFGTGFVIDQHDGHTYILTCAHVVRNAKGKEGKIKVNDVIAEEVAISPPYGADDLAVLRVQGQIGAPLSRSAIGEKGLSFTSLGYQPVMVRGMTESVITARLQGTLGASIIQQIRGQSFHTKLWELDIKEGSLPLPGYSGAPIVVDTAQGECVIGVLRMQQGERILAISIEALDRVWPEQIHVPFINREDERKLILSSSAPAYYLLDGPAGYGKSALLRTLQKEFFQRKWSCAYLVLNSSLELDELAEAVAEKLSISRLLPSPKINQSPGFRLGSALQTYWDNSQEGIVLLFDFDKGFGDSAFLERLLKEFIPEIEESLKNISPFDRGDNRFRVVIAGRYLNLYYNRLSVQTLPVIPSLQYLTPFTYDVIQNSTHLYLPRNHIFKRTEEIAGHIFHLTGGHPGCMARVLQQYKESGMAPENFVYRQSDKIWNEIVRPMVNSIEAEFPTAFGVHKLMRNNVLRYMDYTALGKMVDILEISEVRDASDFDEIDLSDELTGAALLNWNNYLLHDDITRRLICLGLRNDRRDEFVRLCQSARTICEERLLDTATATADKWAIEYLFQSLQQHALLIGKPEQRRELRYTFISQELPKVRQWLATGRRAREQQRYLLRSIDQDWEFRFTVNYYLRENEYNDEPVKELKSAVNRIL
jgi:hypothetical protein